LVILMDQLFEILGDPRSGTKAAQGQVQDYESIKNYCLQNRTLFEDPVFSPSHSGSTQKRSDCEWLRPHQISQNPKFISSGVSRFDVIQGELGDCWLIAAMANLSLNQRLFSRVVPLDQSFEPNQYAGIFHFRFWQFGKWVDVVIDDRLPTTDGKLLFVRSHDDSEFWAALLEKAYAKLHGSYESLRGGSTLEATVDLTGGLTEFFEIQSAECPSNLFNILLKGFERQSLIGASIEAQDDSELEHKLANGLIKGHAYSVTSVIELPYQGRSIPLLRLRNPWSGTSEWNGPWSDRSTEWSRIPDHEKRRLGLTFEADGEFWISFQDFKRNFTRVEMCNLGPDAVEDDKRRTWYAQMFEGSWVAGISAGGCRNNLHTFSMNPQYVFTLVDHDKNDGEDVCTCIVALMQKHKRSKYKMGSDQLTIGFNIYELRDGVYQKDPVGYSPPQAKRQLLNTEFFKYNCSVARSPTYINLREISARFQLKPGTYCVIPSTYDKDEEGDFLLRIWTEGPPSQARENDDIPGLYPVAPPVQPSPTPSPTPRAQPQPPKPAPRQPSPAPGVPTYPMPMPTPVAPSYPMPTPAAPSYPAYPDKPTPHYPDQPTPAYPPYPSYPSYPADNGISYPPLPDEPIVKPARAPEPPPGPRYPDINVQEVISTIQTVINILTMCWSTFQKMQASTSPMSGGRQQRGNMVCNENVGYTTNYRTHATPPNRGTNRSVVASTQLFKKVADPNLEVGPKELQKLLSTIIKKHYNIKEFSLETCRSLVATLDADHSGKLGPVEFSYLWSDIQRWATIFTTYDRNSDGCIDASELREALQQSGIRANRKLLSNMVKRYGNVEQTIVGPHDVPKVTRSLSFDAFVHCCVKLRFMITLWQENFAKISKQQSNRGDDIHARRTSDGEMRMIDGIGVADDDFDGTETAPFTLDEFVTSVMYS
ncbi:Calpain-A, partial [Fragariocoptes setiger]